MKHSWATARLLRLPPFSHSFFYLDNASWSLCSRDTTLQEIVWYTLPPPKKLFIWLFCQHFGLKIKCLIAQRFNMTQQNVTLYLRIFSYLSVLMISETIRLCKLLKWPHQGALPPDVKQNTCPIQAGQCEQNCLVKPNTSTAKISIAEQCFSNSWNVQKFSLYLMLVLLSFYLKFSATSLLHSETVAVDKNTSSMVLGWQRWAI